MNIKSFYQIRIYLHSLLAILLLAVFTVGCSDDENKDSGDEPTQEPVFTAFSPEKGKAGDLITITGSYFGTDPSRITVLINNTISAISYIDDNTIEVTVPEDCGSGKVHVGLRRGQSGTLQLFEKIFENLFSYTISANVSTFAGRTGLKNEYTFGALLDSKLYGPGQLLVDNDDNIYLSEWNRGIRLLTDGQTSRLLDFYHSTDNVGGFGTGDWVSDFKAMDFSPNGDRLWLLGARPASRGQFLGYALKSENYANYYGDSTEDMDGFVGLAVNPVDGTIALTRNLWGPFEELYIYDIETHKATELRGYTKTWASSESHPVFSKDGRKLFILHQGLHYISRYDYDPSTKTISNEFEEFAGKKELREDAGDSNRIKGYGQGYADGKGSAARFDTPQWGYCDNAGNLYVTDRRNHCIRKVDGEGNVTTLAGLPCPGQATHTSSFKNGELLEAVFNQPSGICLDSKGNIYVSEEEFADIRKIVQGNE